VFWQQARRRVAVGEVVDFFAYPDEIRFRNRFATEPAGSAA
jgi:hypothetical protein